MLVIVRLCNNKDLEFDNIIVLREEGKSGDDYDNETLVVRELLGICVSKIEKGLIKDFWVYDSSRLSRSSELSLIIFKIFNDNSCRYYINNELRNIDDIDSSLMLKILSVFDEYENFKRHNKLMVGKIEHLKDVINTIPLSGLSSGSLFIYKSRLKAILINYPNKSDIFNS